MSDVLFYIGLGVIGLLTVYALFVHEPLMIWRMDRSGTRPRCQTCDNLIENTYDIFHGIAVCESCNRARTEAAYQRRLKADADAEARRIEAAVPLTPAYRELLERVQSLEWVNGLQGGKP